VSRRLIMYVSFVLTFLSLYVYFFPNLVLPLIANKTRPPTSTRTAQVSAERWYAFGAAHNASGFLRTRLDVSYESPIRVDQSATVSATVRQIYVLDRGAPEKPSPNGPVSDSPEPRISETELNRLQWNASVRLTSTAFDFADGDAERQIKAETPLPVNLVWHPSPKEPGLWKLTLNLRDLNGNARTLGGGFLDRGKADDSVEVTMDGKSKVVQASDDISIPVDVWTEYGVPEIVVKWVTALFAVLTALMGAGAAFYAVLGRLLRAKKPRKP
jgi:hypothetical protein